MFGFNKHKSLTEVQFKSAVAKAYSLISRTRDVFKELYITDLKHEDRKGLTYRECQLLVLALYLNLIKFCVQDTLYDDGTNTLLSRVSTKELSHKQHRAAISKIFRDFYPPALLNIDMIYRYMSMKKLYTDQEVELANFFLDFTNKMLDRHFYEHQASHYLDTHWLEFIKRTADGEGASAFEALGMNYQDI